MVHASAINDDDFEATTRSVGCATALLPQRMRDSAKAVNTWCRTNSSFIMRAQSRGALKKNHTAKTTSVDPREAWAEMRHRFKVAHGRPATRSASEGAIPTYRGGNLPASAQDHLQLGALSAQQSLWDPKNAPHSKSAIFFRKGAWVDYVAPQPVEVSGDLCA